MSDAKITDALHAHRLSAIESQLKEFRAEFRESLKPLTDDVRANTAWRERATGALRLAALIVGLLGSGAIGWAAYLTVTTISTQQAVERLGEDFATKAPPRSSPQPD